LSSKLWQEAKTPATGLDRVAVLAGSALTRWLRRRARCARSSEEAQASHHHAEDQHWINDQQVDANIALTATEPAPLRRWKAWTRAAPASPAMSS